MVGDIIPPVMLKEKPVVLVIVSIMAGISG
jgi:hypothetical protein